MNKNILIVDDEEFIRSLVGRALEPLEDVGVIFAFAEGGQHALTQVELFPADLIILDIMMPDLNGVEVCKQVKKRLEPPYVLLLTAKTQTEDKLDALEAGADEYMEKPFDPDRLLDRVCSILRINL